MIEIPAHIDFRFRKENDTYVIWLAAINRYLQLKEPAFEVFKKWANGCSRNKIVKECCNRYHLPLKESKRFVNEIITEIQSLYNACYPEKQVTRQENVKKIEQVCFSEYYYQFDHHLIQIQYGNKYLEDLFHPLFRQYKSESGDITPTRFELYTVERHDLFLINGTIHSSFHIEDVDSLQGAVYMELLNIIHNKSNADWMGVLHALAVTDGNSAILFSAPSGNGKSSIALLMMAKGYNLFSDDFVPIALDAPEIYHFPSEVSIKPGAIPFLKKHVPELYQTIKDWEDKNQDSELFVSPFSKTELHSQMRTNAIVFVNYDPETEYTLTRESNLKMMDHFLLQAWINNSPEAAGRFLEWYFSLPIYTLRYSDNIKAINGIGELFESE